MPTLVTGAAGFVGLNLTEALLGAGRDVVAYDARPELPQDAQWAFAGLPGALRFVRGDVLDRGALRAALPASPMREPSFTAAPPRMGRM